MKQISVAKDFTPFPFGRYRKEGEYSGESFRDDLLIPAIKAAHVVQVNLDNVLGGLGSSFLEEVFGGLVRKGFTKDDIKRKIQLISDEDPSIVRRTWMYINRAAEIYKPSQSVY